MATPHCPYCQSQSPACLGLQSFAQFGLVYCTHCGAIFGVVSLPSTSPPKAKIETPAATDQRIERPQIETPATRSPVAERPQSTQPKPEQKPVSMLEVIGNADLSNKQPYDPVMLANQARSGGFNRGSRYVHVAIDDGPPLCPHHKVEMSRATIPAGYLNTGREVWLCPQFNACGEWELAK